MAVIGSMQAARRAGKNAAVAPAANGERTEECRTESRVCQDLADRVFIVSTGPTEARSSIPATARRRSAPERRATMDAEPEGPARAAFTLSVNEGI